VEPQREPKELNVDLMRELDSNQDLHLNKMSMISTENIKIYYYEYI
jgi:hypothetical protein